MGPFSSAVTQKKKRKRWAVVRGREVPSRKEKHSEIGEAFPYWRTLDEGGEVRAVSQKLQTPTANSCQLTKPLLFCLKKKKKKRVKLCSSNNGIVAFSPF